MTETEFHSESHKRLNVLAGVWDTTITMLDANGDNGETSQATDTYRWMTNGHFLVHDVDATMGGQRIQSTEIFSVNSETGAFASRSYDADGSMKDFTSNIVDRTYTINGETQRFSGEFGEDGNTLQGEWQQLSHGQWSRFVRIVLKKKD